MKILYIAPLPPPITGHSIAAEVLCEHLKLTHEVAAVDLSVGSSNDGSLSRRRILEVGKILVRVWRGRRGADVVYLTVSESVAGNIKDLLIYLLCARMLSRFYIHLHGGSIKKLLFDRHPILRWLNSLAIGRMAGVIVSGRSHEHIFAPMIAQSRIHLVPNFALDELFVSDAAVAAKFANTSLLRVLYISGMTAGKGYQDLADAYLALGADVKRRVRVDFAGKFDTELECAQFTRQIAGDAGICYHGLVDDETKRRLFSEAHVFCLPTTMFEGQPISILEAYASACLVLATGQDGIRDVFTDAVNGIEIHQRCPTSIAAVLTKLSRAPDEVIMIATKNHQVARRSYRVARFTTRMGKILSDTASRNES